MHDNTRSIVCLTTLYISFCLMKDENNRSQTSRKHVRVRYAPLNPTLYKKWGIQGYIYFLFISFIQNINCGYSLESPRRGRSNVYPQSMLYTNILKLSKVFPMKFSSFNAEKKSLHGQIFVMRFTSNHTTIKAF